LCREDEAAVSRAHASVEVKASPEDVWKVVANPRNLPRWDRHITTVEGVPPNGLTRGSGYSTRVQFMGVGARVNAKVLEIEPPRYAKVRVEGFMDATVETTIAPLGNGRSRLEHDVLYRFRGGPIGKMAAQALRMTGGPQLVLRRGTMAQKRQAEEG
jgi:carbon monoxide dehydrogenase subunit G